MATIKFTVRPETAPVNEAMTPAHTPRTWPAPWATAQSKPVALANGAGAAALLSAGLGCAVFGLFVVLNEASATFHDLMILNSAVGPLSGKSTFPVLIWLVSWGLCHLRLRKREVNLRVVTVITALLLLVALLCTFPPFFMLFATE